MLQQAKDPNVMIIDANKEMRRELFKLTYLQGTHPLYNKCDSQEALISLMTYLHALYIDVKLRIKSKKGSPAISFD